MGIDLGNLAALRTFRVLRALKTVAIIPGKFLLPRLPSPVFSRLGALSMEKINRVGCLRVIKLGTSRNPPVLLLLHCIDLIPFDDGIILIQPALPQPR